MARERVPRKKHEKHEKDTERDRKRAEERKKH